MARRKCKNPFISSSTAEDGLPLLRILKHWSDRNKSQGGVYFRVTSVYVQGDPYCENGAKVRVRN